MPDENNTIGITTSVDLPPLRAGMAEAQNIVAKTTRAMTEDFAQANAALKAQVDELKTSFAASQEQIQALETKIAGMGRHTVSESTEARHALHGLGEEIGVRMPRFLQSYVTQLEGVAPLMAKAFSVIAIIGLIEIIPELINKINETAEALGGMDKEAKKAYADMLDGNRKMVMEQLHLNQALRETNSIGLTGPAKAAANLKDLAAGAADASAELTRTRKEIEEDEQYVKDHTVGLAHFGKEVVGDLGDMSDDVHERIAKAKEELPPLRQRVDELTRSLDEWNKVGKVKGDKELAAENMSAGRELAAARVDAEHRTALELISAREQAAKEQRSLYAITLEQEVAALEKATNEKLEVERRYIAEKRALALREQSETGKPAGPALTGLHAEQEAAETAHQRALTAIHTAAANERRRLNQELSLASIASNEKQATTEAEISANEARRQLEAHKVTIAQETEALVAAERDRAAAREEATRKQLDEYGKESEKNAAKIIALQAELVDDEKLAQDRIAQIRAEGAAKQLELDRRLLDERLAMARQEADMELDRVMSAAQRQASMRGLFAVGAAREETAAVQKWFEAQAGILREAAADARASYGEQSVEYQKMLLKMDTLDRERAKKQQQIETQALQIFSTGMDRMRQTFVQEFDAIVMKQKTAGQAMSQAWNSILLGWINDLVNFGIQWAEMQALKLAKHLLTNAGILASDTTTTSGQAAAAAAAAATTSATNVAMAQSDAAVAAAGTLAYYSAFAPEIAPAMAGIQLSIGEGFAGLAAFETGGLVPRTGIAMLHQGEQVVNRPLTSMLTNIAQNSSSRTSTGSPVHFNYAPTINGAGGDFAGLLTQHSAHIARIFKSLVRSGAIDMQGAIRA